MYPFQISQKKFGKLGELLLCIRLRSPKPGDEKTLKEYLVRFVNLALSGALCGSNNSPALSNSVLLGFGPSGDSSYPLCSSIDMVNVDSSAAFVLFNMLDNFNSNIRTIEAITTAWSGIPASLDLTKRRFPGRPSNLSFSLEEDADVGMSFDVRVDFEETQTMGKIKVIDEQMGEWFAAASLGAYGDESFPPASSAVLYTDDPVQLRNDSILWRIDHAICSDCALDGLISCVERISLSVAPVSRMLIGA